MTDFKRIFFDTAPFIYYLDYNELYFSKVKEIFIHCYKAKKVMVTSVATIEEYCVYPYKNKCQGCIDAFDTFIMGMGINVYDVNVAIAKKAARIRAEYKGFKTMDAIQLATACLTGCDLFLTNDKQLRQFKEIKCVTVEGLQ